MCSAKAAVSSSTLGLRSLLSRIARKKPMSRAYSGAYAIAQTGAGPSSCSMGVTSAKAAGGYRSDLCAGGA